LMHLPLLALLLCIRRFGGIRVVRSTDKDRHDNDYAERPFSNDPVAKVAKESDSSVQEIRDAQEGGSNAFTSTEGASPPVGRRSWTASAAQIAEGSPSLAPAWPTLTSRRQRVSLVSAATGFISMLVMLSLWQFGSVVKTTRARAETMGSARTRSETMGPMRTRLETMGPVRTRSETMKSMRTERSLKVKLADSAADAAADVLLVASLPEDAEVSHAEVSPSTSASRPLGSPRLQAYRSVDSYDVNECSFHVRRISMEEEAKSTSVGTKSTSPRPAARTSAGAISPRLAVRTSAGTRSSNSEETCSDTQPVMHSVKTIGGTFGRASLITAGAAGELREKLLSVHTKRRDHTTATEEEEGEEGDGDGDRPEVGKQ